ncbi:MAG: aminopeptidase N [Planctomycetota bacterium]|jgi:aminopeptidase N
MNASTVSKFQSIKLLGLFSLTLLTGACHLDWNAEAPPILPVSVELPVATAKVPRASAIDVQHYAIRLELFPEARAIEARCNIDFVAKAEDLLAVEFDFAGLEVEGVRDPEGNELEFVHEDGKLIIHLQKVLLSGARTELSIDYSGSPQKGLWFAGDKRGMPTHVFTQGECEDSHWWFPCWDSPADFASTEVTVTMPVEWKSMAAGELVDRQVNGRTVTEHWRMDQPHAVYLTTLVAGDFVVKEDSWEGVPLYYLAEPRYAKWMESSFNKTGEVLTFLSDFTGVKYPYAKYSQACVENFPFGGMENISATTLTTLTLDDELGQRDAQSTGLVAHEAAHQWFGNLVTCEDWSQIWLNEGFATYAALLFTENNVGVDEFRIAMRNAQESYIRADLEKRRPIIYSVYKDPMDLFGGHVYPGGASRLHLLRSILGDDVFVAGVREYMQANRGQSVRTAHLKRAMQQVSGENLDWFFDQWLREPGFPEFEVDWSWNEEGRRLTVNVSQTQTGVGGVPRVFRTPVDIEIRDRGGRSTQRVWISERKQSFDFTVDHSPIWVRFDKFGWIPKTLNSKKSPAEWLAIAEDDDDVNGRRDAIKALGSLAANALDPETREVYRGEIAARLRTEKNAAVRVTAAEAAAAAGGIELRTQLEDAATMDTEAAVREAALLALVTYGPAADLAQLAVDSFDDRFSWDCMAAAAELYASANPEDAYGWLTKKLFEDSPHDQLRSSLLRVLAKLENHAVADQLKHWAADDSSHPAARAVAIAELVKLARGRSSISKFLIDMLDEDDFRLRGAVVEGLGEFRDPATRRKLYSYYQEAIFPSEKRAIEAALGTGL